MYQKCTVLKPMGLFHMRFNHGSWGVLPVAPSPAADEAVEDDELLWNRGRPAVLGRRKRKCWALRKAGRAVEGRKADIVRFVCKREGGKVSWRDKKVVCRRRRRSGGREVKGVGKNSDDGALRAPIVGDEQTSGSRLAGWRGYGLRNSTPVLGPPLGQTRR